MTPWTLMSLLLLLVSVVLERGFSTERLLPSEEACKRMCWYNKLCKSLRWNSRTGGCEVSTTEVLSSNRSGVVTFTLSDLNEHWEFPGTSHPCAAQPCAQGYLCVPVEAATDQVCLPTGTATGEETDDHVTTSTTSNTTECIEVTCLGYLNTTRAHINSDCSVTCVQGNGNFPICKLPKGFITCSNGDASFTPCNGELTFDKKTGICDHSNRTGRF